MMGEKKPNKNRQTKPHKKKPSCISPLFFHTHTNLTAAFCCLLPSRASAGLHCVRAWTSGSIQYNRIQSNTTQHNMSWLSLAVCASCFDASRDGSRCTCFSVRAHSSDVSVNHRVCVFVCV